MADKDDRPVCKYGEKCYRTNAAHLSQFKHAQKLQQEQEKQPKMQKRKSTETTESPVKKKTKIDDFFQKVSPPTSTGGQQAQKNTTIEDFIKKPDVCKTTAKEEKDDDEAVTAVEEASSKSEVTASHGNSSGYIRPADSDNQDKNEPLVKDDKTECTDETTSTGTLQDAAQTEMDPKQSIKEKFLVEMPADFYDLWTLCKKVKPLKPESAFANSGGLKLVGPYDVLAGKCKPCIENRKYLIHWRYYYDPPEFLTVLKGDDQSMFHIGYFRDDPKEMPAFVASNSAAKDCIITPRGENIFAAIAWHLTEQNKHTKSKEVEKLLQQVKDFAAEHNYNLDLKTQSMKERNKRVVCKTFHGAGLVVPVDENDVGYRPVPETPGDLKKLFKKINDSKSEAERNKSLDELQEIVTLVQFANDECDYGEGLELGLDLFSYGGSELHSFIKMLLPIGYRLTGRTEYEQIIVEHLKNRRKTAELSQISTSGFRPIQC
ncbi:histone PARylation factor 1-like [Tubulanus polymorphus]|uniref:histone PARylation factor 1-like n=1 Tax=Tubulanus polymorphus TaxID=672921 RepID=UPI003DA5FB62